MKILLPVLFVFLLGSTAHAAIVVNDAEPADDNGLNDNFETAQRIEGFGTQQDNRFELTGRLAIFDPFLVSEEVDSAIPLANQGPTATFSIASGTFELGAVPGGTDYDFFELNDVQAGQQISAIVNVDAFPGSPPVGIGIFNAEGTLIASSGPADPFFPAQASVTANITEAGNYYICVTGGTAFAIDPFFGFTFQPAYPQDPFDPNSPANTMGGPPGPAYQGPYGVVISRENPGVVNEDDGSIANAQILNLIQGEPGIRLVNLIGDGPHGSSGTGTGDFDFYALPGLRAGQLLNLLYYDPLGFGSPTIDAQLWILDASGNVVLDDEFDGATQFFGRFFAVREDGDYFLVIGGGDTALLNDPNDSGSGPGADVEGVYRLQINLFGDTDFYSFDLNQGDVLGIDGSVEVFLDDGTRIDTTPVYSVFGPSRQFSLSDLNGFTELGEFYPDSSPLPKARDTQSAFIASESGEHFLAISTPTNGDYFIDAEVYRPGLESQAAGAVQYVFVDFDGAVIDTSRFSDESSPSRCNPDTHPQNCRRSQAGLAAFLTDLGLQASDEDAIIDRVMSLLGENFSSFPRFAGNNGDRDSSEVDGEFDIEFLNSRDDGDVDVSQPNVTHLVIGGSRDTLGFDVYGAASSIDPGNFDTNDVAILLLDTLSAPANPDPMAPIFERKSLNDIPRDSTASMLELVGQALGDLSAHYLSRTLGNVDTVILDDDPASLTSRLSFDDGLLLNDRLGLGPDGIFGTTDDLSLAFGQHERGQTLPADGDFSLNLAGPQDEINTLSFALSTGSASGIFFDVISGQLFVTGDTGPDLIRVVRGSTADEVNITINTNPAQTFSPVSAIVVNGGDGDDELIVDYANGDPVPPGGIRYDGQDNGANGDVLTLEQSTGMTAMINQIVHNFTNASSGQIDVDGSQISYTGLEPVTDNLNAAIRIFSFSAVMDVIALSNQGATLLLTSQGTSESVNFVAPTSTLTINAGGGNDVISVADNPNNGLFSGFTLTIEGGGGDDVLGSASFPTGITISGGDGDDRLFSGSGDDVLIGGMGDDVYVFSPVAPRLNLETDTVSELAGEGFDSFDFTALDSSDTVFVRPNQDMPIARHDNREINMLQVGQAPNIEEFLINAENLPPVDSSAVIPSFGGGSGAVNPMALLILLLLAAFRRRL